MQVDLHHKVVVRRFKPRWDEFEGLVALLPEDPSDLSGDLCTAYMVVGGHSAANISLVMERTVPVHDVDQLMHLLSTLKFVGYENLKLYNKVTPSMHKARRKAAERWHDQLEENPLQQISPTT